MSKLINYFYPKQKMSFFDNKKTLFFVLQIYIGFIIVIISFIPELISPNDNFIISFYSKGSGILILLVSLFILKKKGVIIAGNIYSLVMVISLLIWMNIFKDDITPIYKYIQGFYSVFAVLIISLLFASRKIIIINTVLILATTTRILIFAKTHSPDSADFFTTGYISHTVGLLFIATVIYFASKFAELAIKKAKDNELKFKQLSDLTIEGIFIHDKGVAIDYNLACEKMFGYNRDEIIGKNVISFLVVGKYHKLIFENIANNYTLPYEIEAIKKDGTVFPIEFEAKSIKFEDSNTTVRVTAVRDISQRKNAEKQIKRLSSAVEQSANTIVITDIEGNIEYVNKKFTEITGYSAQEAIGQNPRILNSGTQPKEYYTEMWRTITDGKMWKGEFHNKKKNGNFFWEQVTITPLKDDFGQIINYLAIKEDITTIKENQKILENERLFNDRLVETLPGIFFLYEVTKDGAKLIKWNNNHEIMLGYSKEDLQSMFALDFFNPEEQKDISKSIKKILKGDEISIEVNLKHKDGHTIPYFVKSLGFKNNKKQYFLGIGLNISNIKKAEHKLLIKNQKLHESEEKIRTSNEKLLTTTDALRNSNDELILANERAVESDRLKTEFLNNISHEVRTPLNGIMGFSQLLNTVNLSDDNRKYYINIINNSGNQLLRIIDDIIEISRLETKQIKTVEKAVNLNKLLSNLYSVFEVKANVNKTQLFLKSELTNEQSNILTDKIKLFTILNNLLDNAIKFTNNGSIEFGYSIITKKDSKLLQLYVKDTGIGIKTKKQELIFNRFAQAESKLSRNYGGLGLGLSIAKENTLLLGGEISLVSEKGIGSTFFVTIPLKPIV